MATFSQIFYHIIFSTKNRERVLFAERRDDLFRYIWGVIKNNKGHLYRINGIEDHIHILTSIHPTICLADFVKDIKTGASKWIKENRIFPQFSYWQDGYGAFTHSIHDKNDLIEYIKNQNEHHKGISFQEEYKRILINAGVEFNDEFLG